MTTAALARATASDLEGPFRVKAPLTERVLARLPGPRVVWMLAWGLSPFAAYEIAYRLWQLPTYAGVESNIVIGVLNLVALWAAGRLGDRIDRLQPTLERLLRPGDLGPRTHPFRHVGSVKGPLAVAVLLVLSWDFLDFLRFPGLPNAFTVVTVGFGMTAIATFLWVYGVALLGLDRIGRRRLDLLPFTTDPILGLKPLGSLAFEAFVLGGLVVGPALALLLTDPRSIVETLGTMAILGGLFVLSAYTLHCQLATAKSRHVRWARQLIAAALGAIEHRESEAPEAAAMTEALARAEPSLSVATEIERRALAIQEWPFDTAIIRTVAAILTSVTAVIVARLLLSRVGM